MNIKNLRPNANARTKQGYFNISESKKYVGTDKRVIFRSSWEERFCKWCESNPNVSKWASECIEIKYMCPFDNKIKNYYPDFLVRFSNGKIWIVEVKPESEYKYEPQQPKRKTKKSIQAYLQAYKTFVVNNAKFKASIKYCEQKNWHFFVADEKWFKL